MIYYHHFAPRNHCPVLVNNCSHKKIFLDGTFAVAKIFAINANTIAKTVLKYVTSLGKI
jgi:hypothetical protein